MASGLYATGLKEILDGTIDLDNDTLKVMLVNASYTYDPDHDVVDNSAGDATDPSHNEITATNYTKGHAGAGRKTATVTLAADKTNNRATVAIADLTWSSLGGAANDTVAGAILFKEGANDGASRLIAFFDLSDTVTNGGDLTLDFAASAAGGNIQIATS